jgi:hypothetical protein
MNNKQPGPIREALYLYQYLRGPHPEMHGNLSGAAPRPR